ncbi:MAG: NF038122 family metalloprotease [Gemmataceae bacterium]|nr:NF038122 family metalloprotease [Gemmataceae bacterium]
MLRVSFSPLAAMLILIAASPAAPAQLIFNISNQGGASPQMMTAFQQAGALWSARISDPITINVRVNAFAQPPGTIATTNSFFDSYSYSSVRSALVARRTSTDDFSSAGFLQSGPTFSMLINRTANNPAGTVSASPYFDTGLGGPGQAGPENNSTVRMTSSNAKALGLTGANDPGLNGTINFSTIQSYDFDRSNGINPGQVDFIGVAAHEIGHLLGFMSGVDPLDGNGASPGLNDNQLPFVTPLDLFRFSNRSIGAGGGVGVPDWTADDTLKYFSVDGGTTPLAPFANGTNFGDGIQASHWKNAMGLGLMDPTASLGELLAFSNMDLRAFDVIGYSVTPVPEPTSAVTLCLVGLAMFGRFRSPRPN